MADISWDMSSEQQYRNELSRIVSLFQTQKSIIINRAPAVVLGIQDAQRDVVTAQSDIESGISKLQSRDSELKLKLQSILNANEQSSNRIKMLETQVDSTKSSVKEAEILAALRKEQADELQRKGIGNFHSSWMGLWRPLSEQSQIGILIATIFFGLVILIIAVVYGNKIFPTVLLNFRRVTNSGLNFYESRRL